MAKLNETEERILLASMGSAPTKYSKEQPRDEGGRWSSWSRNFDGEKGGEISGAKYHGTQTIGGEDSEGPMIHHHFYTTDAPKEAAGTLHKHLSSRMGGISSSTHGRVSSVHSTGGGYEGHYHFHEHEPS